MKVNSICVIGAGTMGTGIAQVAAQAGICVTLIETCEEAIAHSTRLLENSLEDGIKREKVTFQQAENVRRLITWEMSDEPLAEADWVIEAVFEDVGVKEEVLRRAATLVRKGVPVATNTSTLRIKDLAEFSGRPEYFLGMHFFNPAPAMKLVEVIPGDKTLPAVTEGALALCERMGKVGKISPDIPGFIVNRAFAALVAAAIEVWVEGAGPETIDTCVELGLGHRMGPLKTADLVGLDVMLTVLRSLHAQTGHPRFEVPEEFAELVGSGKLGRKSGEGFYDYGG